MSPIPRLLRWTATPTGRRALAVATTALALLVACNPLLLPLLPVIDALGLDVLVLLLGAQAVASWPWLRFQARRGTPLLLRAFSGMLAGIVGGYLRQLLFGPVRGTLFIERRPATGG